MAVRLWTATATQLHVGSLRPDHAAELLRKTVNVELLTAQQAQELAYVCCYNPLAMVIIGGFITRRVVTAEVRHTAYAAEPACLTCKVSELLTQWQLVLCNSDTHAMTAQVAISAAAKAGIHGFDPSTESPDGAPDSLVSCAAAEREVRRAVAFWLGQYLTIDQQEAAESLTPFAASFDATGAAFVSAGLTTVVRPNSSQQADAAKLLGQLCEAHVIHEVQLPADGGEQRYVMRPLVRDLATGLPRQFRHGTARRRFRRPRADPDTAAIGFMVYMLVKRGIQLAKLTIGRHPANALVAARLLSWEMPKLCSCDPPRHCTGASSCRSSVRAGLARRQGVHGWHGDLRDGPVTFRPAAACAGGWPCSSEDQATRARP